MVDVPSASAKLCRVSSMQGQLLEVHSIVRELHTANVAVKVDCILFAYMAVSPYWGSSVQCTHKSLNTSMFPLSWALYCTYA